MKFNIGRYHFNIANFMNSVILFIITAGFLYFLIYVTEPTIVTYTDSKGEKKISTIKALSMSVGISLIFTIIITLLSSQVDKQYELKKKIQELEKK